MSKKVGHVSDHLWGGARRWLYNPVNAEGRSFWAAVIVLALAIWVIWGMVVGI
jgi:hypothetical protein